MEFSESYYLKIGRNYCGEAAMIIPAFCFQKRAPGNMGVKGEESNEFQINENQTPRASMQARTSTKLD